MNIIGQTKILSKINKYTITQLPKTLMFIGPLGCGKHILAHYVAERLELNYVEINENITVSDLNEYLYSTINTLYVINLNNFTEKQQNQFLKFIEEPSKTTYVLLLATSEAGILNTILNRCIKYTFEPYSKEEIEQITGTLVNDLAYKIFKTPGKLINMTDTSFQSITDLANNLIKNINKATYANSLVISTKINYKDLYNKIDFNLFLDTVEYLSFEDYKNSANEQNLIIYKITNQFKQYATKQNLIKETLMLNYLTTLWEAIHDFNRT